MAMSDTVTAGVTAAFAAIGNLAQTVQVRRSTLGAYSTTTHAMTESTADTAFQGVVSTDEKTVDEDGRVVGRKLTVLLKPGAIDPTPQDHLVIGGTVFRILSAVPTAPGGTVLLWTVKAEG